jgi:hypothetical protein
MYTREELLSMGIYRIVNKTTDKFYIGSTIDCFRNRFNKHKRLLRRNKHENDYLQKAWNKSCLGRKWFYK